MFQDILLLIARLRAPPAPACDELVAAGDDNGAAVWRRITTAVAQLANTTPPGRVH